MEGLREQFRRRFLVPPPVLFIFSSNSCLITTLLGLISLCKFLSSRALEMELPCRSVVLNYAKESPCPSALHSLRLTPWASYPGPTVGHYQCWKTLGFLRGGIAPSTDGFLLSRAQEKLLGSWHCCLCQELCWCCSGHLQQAGEEGFRLGSLGSVLEGRRGFCAVLLSSPLPPGMQPVQVLGPWPDAEQAAWNFSRRIPRRKGAGPVGDH